MFLSLLNPFTDTQQMPKVLELGFFAAGAFLILVNAFRTKAFRREWKTQAGDNRRRRFKMSSHQRIEFQLIHLGWIICWTVAFPAWWMRGWFAGIALIVVAGLLYRNNLSARDAPPYDAGGALDLQNRQTNPAQEEG